MDELGTDVQPLSIAAWTGIGKKIIGGAHPQLQLAGHGLPASINIHRGDAHFAHANVTMMMRQQQQQFGGGIGQWQPSD